MISSGSEGCFLQMCADEVNDEDEGQVPEKRMPPHVRSYPVVHDVSYQVLP
jgi:hypothetical protein